MWANLNLSAFSVGENRSTRRKPTTFGRALTVLLSYEDWVRVYLTGSRTWNLRGERRVVWPLHYRSPKPSPLIKYLQFCNLQGWNTSIITVVPYLVFRCNLYTVYDSIDNGHKFNWSDTKWGTKCDIVTRAIKLILPSMECDNLFITYLCLYQSCSGTKTRFFFLIINRLISFPNECKNIVQNMLSC